MIYLPLFKIPRALRALFEYSRTAITMQDRRSISQMAGQLKVSENIWYTSLKCGKRLSNQKAKK